MPVLIKRYANRKLYNTETSRYITLKGIAELLEQNQEVRVIDNETGEDITSVTLSQILVDTERSNRAVPGNLVSELFQKGGDALYGALRKGVDDANENIEGFQRNLQKILGGKASLGDRDWIALGPPDFERIVQSAFERMTELMDLPKRGEIEALSQRLDRLADAIERLEKATAPPRAHDGNATPHRARGSEAADESA